MKLSEWIAAQPRGVLTRLQDITKLAYSTIHNAAEATPRRPVSAKAARKLSDATGGVVSIEEIIRAHETGVERPDSVPPSAA